MAQPYRVKVLDHSHVAPPQGSVSTTKVPLSYFDALWLFCCPMQRVFFYEFPHPTFHFTHNILPNFKQTLSLTLRHFFPLAGTLTCPLPPNKPYILYNEGDSIIVTVAESDADFNHLISYHARDNRAFLSLVPILPIARVLQGTEQVAPIMAMQITIFPNSGISIGITFNHVAADGRSFNHFIKSWASIYRSGGEALDLLSLPYHNKDVVKDPDGLLSIYLKDLLIWEYSSPGKTVPQHNVRITLVLSRTRIEQMKRWVTSQIRKNDNELGPTRISTYVVTCGFMWVNLIKLREKLTSSDHLNDETLEHFVSVADFRERFGFGVPATYFGNCLAYFFASAKRSELIGENGFAVAAKAIAKRISELEKEPLIGAEHWTSKLWEVVKLGRLVSVAGSPKLRVYETDFGWGRPRKTEVAHIGPYGSFSLHEHRDEEGGVEIGLVLELDKLDLYNEIFVQGMNFTIN